MIQMRCPDCGFVQTLSEEKFLSQSDDFVDCPHCHGKIPKEWSPAPPDSVPDEERHKMLAFSRRILNGGDINKEIVLALEAQVRRYGLLDESAKALGIGYAILGETKKAEQFLNAALTSFPNDPEVLHCLLDLFTTGRRNLEAVKVGRKLLDIMGGRIHEDDVGKLAMALVYSDDPSAAEKLLDSLPHLNPGNPLLKKVRRELKRKKTGGLRFLFKEKGPLHRIWASRRGIGSLEAAKTMIGLSRSEKVKPAKTLVQKEKTAAKPLLAVKHPMLVEYWIYAARSENPTWEQIQNVLNEQNPKGEREHIFKFIESAVEKNELTIEYIVRKEARELFDYPEDLIPCNARDFSADDANVLTNAEMIVRIRLSLNQPTGYGHLRFMVRFTQAIRTITGGVVQDAISHQLWGSSKWDAFAGNRPANLVRSHVQFEALDEGGVVWIHSHGMQKFGLPDVEMENIPADLAGRGRALVMVAAEAIREHTTGGRRLPNPVDIPNSPYEFEVEITEPDEESHFPLGTLKICPNIGDSQGTDGIRSVLEAFAPPKKPEVPPTAPKARRPSAPPAKPKEEKPTKPEVSPVLKEKLLSAHRQARQALSDFKVSFQTRSESREKIHAVKVGFPVQNGSFEWMWVSLDAWRGQSLVGYLENVPVVRKDLRKGSRVQISDGEIFDWVIMQDGKVVKGAYTEKIDLSPRDS